MSYIEEIAKLNQILEMLDTQNFGQAKDSLRVVIRQLEDEIEKHNQTIEETQE